MKKDCTCSCHRKTYYDGQQCPTDCCGENIDKNIVKKINASIQELKRWKDNRDRKTIERAMEAGQKRPLTSDALVRAIEVLEECRKLLNSK